MKLQNPFKVQNGEKILRKIFKNKQYEKISFPDSARYYFL